MRWPVQFATNWAHRAETAWSRMYREAKSAARPDSSAAITQAGDIARFGVPHCCLPWQPLHRNSWPLVPIASSHAVSQVCIGGSGKSCAEGIAHGVYYVFVHKKLGAAGCKSLTLNSGTPRSRSIFSKAWPWRERREYRAPIRQHFQAGAVFSSRFVTARRSPTLRSPTRAVEAEIQLTASTDSS